MKTFLTGVTFLMVAGFAPAFAPAPQPKPVKPLEVAVQGEWTFEWGNMAGKAILARDGTWACQWSGENYIGSWSLSGSRLILEERRTSNPNESFRKYCIDLDEPVQGKPGVTGKVESGVRFALSQ